MAEERHPESRIWLVMTEDRINQMMAQRDDPDVQRMGVELWTGEEPPFSQDKGILQIPITELLLLAVRAD